MTIKKYLNPQNDIAFKKIFGEEKNKEILLAMLNAVLGKQLHQPIEEVTYLKTVQEPDLAAKKQSVVDVLCKDKDGCQYVVEMQVSSTKGFEKRAEYYASKAFISQMNKGGLYQDLKAVIFLAFTNFVLFEDKKAYKSEHVTLDKATKECNLKSLSFTFIELPKFAKVCQKPLAKLTLEEKFYYFLLRAPEMSLQEVNDLITHDKIIQDAFDVLEGFSWTEEEVCQYEREVKRDLDYRSTIADASTKGFENGFQNGVKQAKKNILFRMLAKGILTQDAMQEILVS